MTTTATASATTAVRTTAAWHAICRVEDIIPGTGVAALVQGVQIALVRPFADDQIFALSNYDPFSQAFVLARGIVGDKNGVLKITSPIYKQGFDLVTGSCLDDATVSIPTYPTHIEAGVISVSL
jgi:nitrite reductase (NADH) small subunit